MRRSSAVVFVLVVSLAATSCDAFFTTNWFQKAGLVDQDAADLAALPAAGLYERAYSEDGIASAAFFTALEGDAAAKAQVLATLEADWSGTAATAAEQRSAILYAEILLETTQAGAVVDGIVAALASEPPANGDDEATKYLRAALPEAVRTDQAAFTAAINALLDANAAYTAYGSGILAAGGVAAVNPLPIAQAAVLAALVGSIDAATTADPAAILWTAMSTGTAPVLNAGPLVLPTFDQANTPIGAIISASGISLPNFGV